MDDSISRQKVIDFLRERLHFNGYSNVALVSELNKTMGYVMRLSPLSEQDMCNDLMQFIDKEKVKDNRTVADWVVQWILEEIISGKCKITGSATDHKEAKMYVEFTFYRSEHDG